MIIFIGSDHRGFHLKEKLKEWLKIQGYDVTDVGALSYNVADDYPDFAFGVADNVAEEKGSMGVSLCGSGVGVTIAANKVKGIRCFTGITTDMVRHARMHDDCNMIGFSADYTTEEQAKEMLTMFLTTAFEPQDRFTRRIRKIQAREK